MVDQHNIRRHFYRAANRLAAILHTDHNPHIVLCFDHEAQPFGYHPVVIGD